MPWECCPPLDGARVGAHGAAGFVRESSAQGSCPGGYPCTHWGVDLYPADTGQWVLAPEDAEITAVRTSSSGSGPLNGYGPGALRLRGVDPLSARIVGRAWHTLGHLSPVDVAGLLVGQRVEMGQRLARVYVPDGPGYRHLHWEIWRAANVPSGEARGPMVILPDEWLRARRRLARAFAAVGTAGALVALRVAVR